MLFPSQRGEKQKDDSFLFLPSLQCDAVSVLEKEHDYRDEHFDFIQSHLRRFCLQCILGTLCQGIRAQTPRSVPSQAVVQTGHLQKAQVHPEFRTSLLPWRNYVHLFTNFVFYCIGI